MFRIFKIIFSFLFLLLVSQGTKAQCGALISTFPYNEGFEAAPAWTTGGANNDWAWGTPAHPTVNTAGGGVKCWMVGGLTGSFYNYSELSWIMSPCFDFTNLNYPWISFKIYWEDEWKYDGLVLQYSLNGGTSWTNVGAYGDPVNCLNANWYDYNNVTWLTSATPPHGWTGRRGATVGSCQGGNGSMGWVTAKHCMSSLANKPSVRFRFLFGAGTTCNNYDGIAVDDILIDNAPPNSANFTFACAGANTVNFTNTSLMCPTGYLWDFGDGTATSTSQSPSHTYAAPGTYNVTLTSSGPCNASSTITIPVSILAVTATSTNISCGGGNSGTATSVATGNAGTINYNWTPGGQTTSAITGLAAGTYTVSISATGSCPATATTSITQSNVLNSTTTFTPVTCFGLSNGTCTDIPTGGTAPFTYVWSSGGANATDTALAAGTYTVTVSDINGCSGTATATVTQPSALIASANFTPVSCFGGSNGTDSASAIGGIAPYSYLWSGGGTTAVNNGLTAATYTVTVSDFNGCSNTSTTTVTQPAILVVSATATAISCFGGNNGSSTASATGGISPYSFSWSGGPSTAIYSGLIAGTYTVTATDNNGCTNSTTSIITQPNSALSVTSTATPVSCFSGNNGTASANASGGTAPYTYAWSPSGETTPTATSLVAGTYSLTVTDANHCSANTSAIVTQPVAALNATVTNTPATCTQHDGTATVNATGGTSPNTFSWLPTGGNTANAAALALGTYSVTVTDANGCLYSTSTVINSIGSITATISTTPIRCFGETNGTATASGSGGVGPYVYLWGNGATSTSINNIGAGNYCVTATDSRGCKDSTCVYLPNPSPVVAQFSSNPSITTIDDPFISFTDMSTGANSWQWFFGDGGLSNSQNPTYSYGAIGTYPVTLIITNAQGCIDSVVNFIVINGDFTFYAPNAFTPNGDGINNIFIPKGTGWDDSSFELMIFDRWGNNIYNSTNANKGWDGKVNNIGTIAQIDVYVWKVSLNDIYGGSHKYIGSVTLLK